MAEMRPAEGKKKEKVYEITHGTIVVGKGEKAERRGVGKEIREGELTSKEIGYFISEGVIRDTDGPITAAQLGEHVADHLIEIALKAGIITSEGAKFTFGKATFQGRDALRASASVAALKEAITAAIVGKQSAIDELTAALAKPAAG